MRDRVKPTNRTLPGVALALAALLACACGDRSAPFTVFVEPEDQQSGERTVTEAIRGARQSVDVVVYEIGSPQVLAALHELKQRLAATLDATPPEPPIRVMVNGQWFGAADEQTPAVAAMMEGLGVDLATGRSPDGLVGFNWSASTVNLTHQKTIVVDARRPDGTAYGSADELPPSARALVMTLNLQAFDWPGSDCAAPCTFVGQGVGTRDLGVVVRDRDDVFEIEQVFDSDWRGPGPADTHAELGLHDPARRLVWSNGAVGIFSPPPAGTLAVFSQGPELYPQLPGATGTAGLGFYPSEVSAFLEDAAAFGFPDGRPMGNALAVHLDVIAGAERTIDVYNEEFGDPSVIAALAGAARRGVAVRVVMTYSATFGAEWDQLASASDGRAVIHLVPSLPSAYRYVHAKMVLADADGPDADVFIGSQNFSAPSLLYNRELGIRLRGADLTAAALAALRDTFEGDFAITGAGVTWTPPAWADPSGAPQPCPVVVLDAQTSFASQAPALYDEYEGGGCRLPPGVTSGRPGARARGAACDDEGTFPADSVLRCVDDVYQPPLPQGPITSFTPPPEVTVPLFADGPASAGRLTRLRASAR